jgi:hypothetical protein
LKHGPETFRQQYISLEAWLLLLLLTKLNRAQKKELLSILSLISLAQQYSFAHIEQP